MPERAAIVTGLAGDRLRARRRPRRGGLRGHADRAQAQSARPVRETRCASGASWSSTSPPTWAEDKSVRDVVARHREAFGRLDVLVNNAGVGIGAAVDEHQTKYVDLQLEVSLARSCCSTGSAGAAAGGGRRAPQRARGQPLASMAGKSPPPWLSVYAATKAAVIAYTTAMNKELNDAGVKSVAFCPGFVDTDMSEFVKESIPAEEMLRTSDIAEALRFVLRLSPNCVIPEIVFQRPAETI